MLDFRIGDQVTFKSKIGRLWLEESPATTTKRFTMITDGGQHWNDRLCENSEASKTVEKRNHISPKIDDLIPKSVSFMLQSGTT
jgi:hypothetical protein